MVLFNHNFNPVAKIKNIQITTPKRFLLNGLFIVPESAKTIYIFIHGLEGSVFSQVVITQMLATNNAGVLSFNNRGANIISKVYQRNKKDVISHEIGTAHEHFIDCVDDIDGAVAWASQLSPERIILLGHSTGCNKSVYYLSKRSNSIVKGVILLAPMSDFADTFAFTEPKIYNRAVATAKKMVAMGKGEEFLPNNVWGQTLDAQRFLSLYTPESEEEIFGYASGKKPTRLQKIKVPLCVVLAENDKYADRPIVQISEWFYETLCEQNALVKVVASAPHNFSGTENEVKKIIVSWLSTIT